MKKWKTLPPNIRLRLVEPGGHAYELPLLPAVLGGPGADIVLDHPTVSAEHARIELAGGVLVVRDLASRKGTWVNGRRVGDDLRALEHGDTLALGSALLRVDLQSVARQQGRRAVAPLAETVPAGHEEAQEAHRWSTARSVWLVVNSGGGQQRFLLDRPVQTIGRLADIRISDPALSRKHLQVEIHPDRVCLKDLASANGTYVDGHRISYLEVDGEVTFSAGSATFHLVANQRA